MFEIKLFEALWAVSKLDSYESIESASVLTSKQLDEWREWNECEWVNKYWFEVCSQMEMKLVEDADIFLHAGKSSSWSETVVERRKSNEIGKFEWDGEVLETIDEFYDDIVSNLSKNILGIITN